MKPLEEYIQKRDFKKTREPVAKVPKKAKSAPLIFVVQEHHASHLHYDFRLEWEGVLKSWAVPKGPSMEPKDKRLAVEVEDHPYEYAKFKGEIPEGEYGAGVVDIWDSGTWEPIGNADEGLKKGRLEFRLKGKRLSGTWLLVRTQRKTGKKSQWLLMKRTESATPAKKTTQLTAKKSSARKSELPEFIEPQLALLVSEPPEGDQWLHEMKFDGYRIEARVEQQAVQLLTRSSQDWTDKYPPVAKQLEKLKVKNAIFDGEVVVLDPQGRSDFQLLQNAASEKDFNKLLYFVFDLLFLDGEDLRSLPLEERKAKLKRILKPFGSEGVIRYVDEFDVAGDRFLKASCELGLEGIISKLKSAPYMSGRHEQWVKSKCLLRQEFVIGGYTDPQGARQGFGALLLGVYEKGQLRYVGKVGTGFNGKNIASLLAKLEKLETEDSPFELKSPRGRGLHWVKPKLAAEIKFGNWTQDKILRVPVYQGLREDKPVKEIKMEKPIEVDSVELTHPDKILYKQEKITKQQLADYLRAVAPFMLPHVAQRPLTLLRCPNGSATQCFFQKHYKEGAPAAIGQVDVEEKNKSEPYMLIDDETGLVSLLQLGTLEIHAWGSRAPNIENPDQIVMDFDPGPSVPWKQVQSAAFELKEILDSLKLQSFVKVTGGKGIHVHIPVEPIYTWEQIKNVANTLALEMISRKPDLYTSDMSKNIRDKKIFIDYLRNARGATSVMPYSMRAKAVSAVAMPIEWNELKKLTGANVFTIEKALQKLSSRQKDPWADFLKVKQKIPLLEPQSEGESQASTGAKRRKKKTVQKARAK
jgi:bifunctional non-homologous end joining protein LigD